MENIYNRMLAKKIPNQHCRLCGDPNVALIKTSCCNQWICCDTEEFSYRGGGFCQFEHEHHSQCYFHYNETHSGESESCKECKKFFGNEFTEKQGKAKYKKAKGFSAAEIYRAILNNS